MVYSLTYRRPAYVPPQSSRVSISSEKSERAESVSSAGSCPYGIPDALSFDKIISGGTCPPCTTRDFMNFLVYIEHAAENLQFFLWYKDYCTRFAKLPPAERGLAREWTLDLAETEALYSQNIKGQKKVKAEVTEVAEVFKGTDFEAKPKMNVDQYGHNPFNTPPRTPTGNDRPSFTTNGSDGWTDNASTLKSEGARSYNLKAAQAFEQAEAHQPFTIQPFREEINRIIAIYLVDGGARQLNLSDKERKAIVYALSITTHPTAFRNIVSTVEWSLRHQAHPNFIRWTICNGNRPRVLFARGLGVAGIVGGLVAAILLTLSSAGRAWRVLSAVGFMVGIATLIAAWKGMCVVLHGMHHRHLRPWELFSDDGEEASEYELRKGSFDSLGSSNSYEDEPWLARYKKRNVIRKVFDREIWIQEPALRQIQDTIFLQALGGAFIITAVSVGIFVALPHGGYF